MISLSLQQIVAATGGNLKGADLVIQNIFTDTRQVASDGLFVALKGANFDAHDFIKKAEEAGAKALLVEREVSSELPQVIVANSKEAMGKIAQKIVELSSAKFVGLTGSVGKTTVKEMIACVLSLAGNTLATKGNLNNDIGVPLTLFRLEKDIEYAVIEMGANQPGDIRYASGLVHPDVAFVNNVAAAHLEGFGDLQGVATAKGEIYPNIKSSGTALVNLDDAFAAYWLERIKTKVLTFGLNPAADINASQIRLDENGCAEFILNIQGASVPVQLNVPGQHNVPNALACAGACYALGIELSLITQGLQSFSGVAGRLQVYRPSELLTVIDDSYNANYTSLAAGIDVLMSQSGVKILALGDMGELGEHTREYHEKAGEYAKQAGVDILVTIGVHTRTAQSAFKGKGFHAQTQAELIEYVSSQLIEKTTILIKGSRSARMENIVRALTREPVNIQGGC
ncbi:MAG: UDP-N-acetylmuramoyl-tripeptide--D-alanyl-D-alanine ligase [Gammaproteobacteria bacterium]|nr:UDP-N-acetylmuramoyl-tripeptide--D-alanyl-D-alanine ligase [Gammaproteobacteria bacterium]